MIPDGADLLMHIGSVLHDEKVFEEPEKFKPERYLEGDIVLKKQRTLAFSIGKYYSQAHCFDQVVTNFASCFNSCIMFYIVNA